MLNYRRVAFFQRLFNLLAFDVIVSLALIWLIYDSPRRWPILLVFVPLLLIINVWLGRRAFGLRNTPSYALPAIYFGGLIFAILQAIEAFTWLRLGFVLLPLTLLVVSVMSVRRREVALRNGE